MYTIFIDDLVVHFTESEPSQGIADICEGNPERWLRQTWSKLEANKQTGRIYLVVPDAEAAWKTINSLYMPISAAGGIVRNGHNEVLFIHRLGRWDLPKGKIEAGEDIESCALREVEEECGLQGHSIVGPLPDTYHVYHADSLAILKRTIWFAMRVEGRPQLTPQTEEQIAEAKWLPVSDWDQVESNTYPSIRSLIEAYRLRYK